MSNLSESETAGDPHRDRRSVKTREAIKQAFLSLLFAQRYDSMSMSDIAERANVARSTLYKHFRSKEELLEVTIAHLFAVLADDAVSEADPERLDAVLAHFWSNRRLAKAVFGPPVDVLMRRSLTALIEPRLIKRGVNRTAAQIMAIQMAAGRIAFLEAWMTGKIVADREQVRAATMRLS
jgi:AcrR family transcriptional regulator